jgi:hypothetical protein
MDKNHSEEGCGEEEIDEETKASTSFKDSQTS